ncbi:ATP-grasp ribosomal peptide maturase [Actinoallomurus sp. NPDC052274]|uniref:ATP-grasp ribosomal peptide maturase n=1 Tax=Actinoallomurus sp. NPDC052274 TaxID=3155420 RepID=UPI003435C926
MSNLVLVLTALEDVTADMVISALNERGIPVARVDPGDIGEGLMFGARLDAEIPSWRGRLRTPSRQVELEEVAAVYYRRPTPYAFRFADLPSQLRDFASAEARHGLGGILNNLDAVYVNHPAMVTRADFKPAQLQRFAELGLRIPPTLVTNDAAQARAFAAEHGAIVYKTFRGLPPAQDGRAGAIWTQRVDPRTFDDSLAVTAHLFQAQVPKAGDVRVTVVGQRVFSQQITTPDGALDWRRGDWADLVHTPVTVPGAIASALQRYLTSFGLVFGCFDFALTGPADDPAQWVAIECNPNGQWGWLPDSSAIADAFALFLSGKEAVFHGDADRRE